MAIFFYISTNLCDYDISDSSKAYNISSRYKLGKTNFYSLINIYKSRIVYQRFKYQNQNYSGFVDSTTYKRILNNLILYGYAFKEYGDVIITSSMSTHPLELKFGDIRDNSNDNGTEQMALNCVSKSIIRDEISTNYSEKKPLIRGRCNLAGSSPENGWFIDIPGSINTENFPFEIVKICQNQFTLAQFYQTDCWKLTV